MAATMLRQVMKAPAATHHFSPLFFYSRRSISQTLIDISPPVKEALFYKHPVVALESAIITHGMPIPHNLETALKLEETVSAEGALPATIAFVKGRIKVGLTKEELEVLALKKEPAIKVSRRDFPAAISRKLNGGTTVAGTMMVANAVGIRVFATGGIGGVHRGVENTMDVSADLVELGRTPVIVVCSGAKAILDIPRTLEYLETQGVGVITIGRSDDFPAFYWAKSGCKSPYSVSSYVEAADFARAWGEIYKGTGSGLIFAVPVPEESAGDSAAMEAAIKIAVQDAEKQGVSGKDLTPFLLGEMNKLTLGAALTINKALVVNNAKTAARISVQLSNVNTHEGGRITVVGGCAVDRVVRVQSSPITLDGATWPGVISECAGGVGRNLAEAIGHLQISLQHNFKPLFVSAMGQDRTGELILEQTSQFVDTSGVRRMKGLSSAAYEVLLDAKGECRLVVGDDAVLSNVDVAWIKRQRLQNSRMVVLDANVPEKSIGQILESCQQTKIPVWFEPTDPRRAQVVVKSSPLWKTLSFASPNLKELRQMVNATGAAAPVLVNQTLDIQECAELAKFLVDQGVANLVITLGRHGCLVVNRNDAEHPFQSFYEQNADVPVTAKYYPIDTPNLEPVSVSGAGDCFAAALIVAASEKWPENVAVAWAMEAANLSLLSSKTVPADLQKLKLTKDKAMFQKVF
ncbi:uncharacterized protein LOC132193136 [Neocloeon triangulifer]|uniref:uncharacterized protein LOC132193136 n=1 Tax=Neocloeon triangulifer TaxID=2078957 RepID=UPI00286F38D6|nr:uncharacterized protein LOC132193136 [Neocloeon triangulifer]XP_059469542.1 uncharacterized protein LOC132193136 [Neocloeon triangulifer]